MIFKDKEILLGVCGGIAAYKSVSLLRLLKKAGARIRVVMTESARKFVGETTFRVLSENDVCTGLFNTNEAVVRHIEWARQADAVVIAPATANMIAKMANGMADDALSTMLLAVTAPVMVCPSMNTQMYEHRAVQRNLDVLEGDGVTILEPGEGELACRTSGAGRLPDPEVILDRLEKRLTRQDLKGYRILVTAGPTRESIDPVRYISNHSSGKMGYAVAEAAEKRGGAVTLVSGPVYQAIPLGVNVVPVESAREMERAVLEQLPDVDVVIKVAAVADYRPEVAHDRKIKKQDQKIDGLCLGMVENPDILKAVGEAKEGRFVVGFAAETHDLEQNAQGKMQRKHLDMIVANPVGTTDSGFGTDTNQVTFFFREGTSKKLPVMPKWEVAHRLLDEIRSRVTP